MTLGIIVKDIFSDVDGHLSSKRMIVAAAMILMIAGFVASVFFNYKVEQYLYDKIMDVVTVGLGMIGSEKFTGRTSSVSGTGS